MNEVRHRSLWDDTVPDHLVAERGVLPGDIDADVAIVGAGYTGLWTAWALLDRDPALRIVVIEAEHVGFGASGRNGGWCSALLPMSLESIAARHGRSVAVRVQRTMNDTVAEIARVCASEGIDADLAMGGTIDLVRNDAQEQRARAALSTTRELGLGEDHLRWLDADEAAAMCGASRVRGALFTPHCAAVHPGKLVRGLAALVERQGVVIHERTRVTSIEPGRVHTERGVVRAEVVVRATEGYTSQLPSSRREMIPLYSLMVATAPLSAEQWSSLAMEARPTFADGRHTIVYGQRTADGRLAFGGRGAPYHYGSRIRPEFDTDDRVRAALAETLAELFPVLVGVEITHHWGGPLGVPRDLHASVRFDRSSGLGVVGGYVGDGVASSNLAARTLADLVTGRDTDLTHLPFVGHRSRRWEPEPLRWVGVNAVRWAAGVSDRSEDHRSGPIGRSLARVVGMTLGR